jgi:hypothetical protein
VPSAATAVEGSAALPVMPRPQATCINAETRALVDDSGGRACRRVLRSDELEVPLVAKLGTSIKNNGEQFFADLGIFSTGVFELASSLKQSNLNARL